MVPHTVSQPIPYVGKFWSGKTLVNGLRSVNISLANALHVYIELKLILNTNNWQENW